MNKQQQIDQLLRFVEHSGDVTIKSTGAEVVTFAGVLYNVDGSSPDPEIEGKNWKELLISRGIDGNCYVTNDTPTGNTHPNFGVGGHMTPNSDGRVELGADSYLMPLCHWHNNKSRDGTAFEHAETKMLKLSGFLEYEVAATFQARLPSSERHTIVYTSESELKYSDLSDVDAKSVVAGDLPQRILNSGLDRFILLEKADQGQTAGYHLRKIVL